MDVFLIPCRADDSACALPEKVVVRELCQGPEADGCVCDECRMQKDDSQEHESSVLICLEYRLLVVGAGQEDDNCKEGGYKQYVVDHW